MRARYLVSAAGRALHDYPNKRILEAKFYGTDPITHLQASFVKVRFDDNSWQTFSADQEVFLVPEGVSDREQPA